MKNFKKIFPMLLMILAMGFVSCGPDDNNPVNIDLADKVVGTYSGRLTADSDIRQDAYIVTVAKLTPTTVSVKAKFFSGDETENFNLSQEGEQIVFKNSTISQFNMFVLGNTMSITYASKGSGMLTYTGTR